MADKINSPGREANAALPLGDRPGLVSEHDTVKTGHKERRTAGPDGGDAAEVGDTFKNSPGGKV
ncbi:hypothetical protein [Caulobacter sp. DWR2-3-1b2]|uniref:hypothetical protein n=1 Tax=unclassified Caulobacter TaxID=2648921 RepID=UPI0019CDEB05|nr:hypothetical protein [Caulobacter sp.]